MWMMVERVENEAVFAKVRFDLALTLHSRAAI
jgi:hypothetical protein